MNRLICFLITTAVFLTFPQTLSTADIFPSALGTEPVSSFDPLPAILSAKSPHARLFEQNAQRLSNSPYTILAADKMIDTLLRTDLFDKARLSDPAPTRLPRLSFFDSPGASAPDDHGGYTTSSAAPHLAIRMANCTQSTSHSKGTLPAAGLSHGSPSQE